MRLTKKNSQLACALALILSTPFVMGGVLDPDCDAGKAAKSAAMKATVGVGGRCKPAEAAKDMSKNAIGIEDKGPIEKQRKKNDDGLAKKAAKKVID